MSMSILDDLDDYQPPGQKRKVGLTFNEDEGRFVLTFAPDISKTELLEAWDRFENARTVLSGKSYRKKTKVPRHIALLLGVRFLRSNGITFNVIHQAYSNKEVPYFTEEYPFDTEFDLKKYYDRNISKV